MVMRRFDVWVGRIAAVVGIVYVLLASLWPLAASAGEAGANAAASSQGFAAHGEATIGMLPVEAALIDIRIGRVIAEVVALRERGEASRAKSRRRFASCPMFPSEDSCGDASSDPLSPDPSTTIVLLIPMVALACAAATTLRGRGLATG